MLEAWNKRRSRAGVSLLLAAALGCGSDSPSTAAPQQALPAQATDGSAGAASGAGATAPPERMPGLGTMTMTAPSGSAGAAGRVPQGAAGVVASGQAGVGAAGSGGAGHMGAAGSSMTGGAGAPAGGTTDGMDPTSVCAGGKVGMDSDAVMTRAMTSSRNFSLIYYIAQAPNKIARFQTILPVPKVPSQRSTLFIWPGLQHSGGADPGGLGNGVLQPVLTWGPSCNPKAPGKGNDYMGWWISAMYVNISTAAAGPGGCAGGEAMDVGVGDRLYIDFAAKGNEWTQTVVNLANMKKVEFTMDLKGQDQNWAIWDIETPGTSRPAEDTYFEKSVLTFTSPVTSCQPSSAPEVDYFSAPILSPDGLHCCFDKMTLKAKRN